MDGEGNLLGAVSLVLNAAVERHVRVETGPQLAMEQSQMAVCDPDTRRLFLREGPAWCT